MPETKSRGMVFGTEKIRYILSLPVGEPFQTRRLITPQPVEDQGSGYLLWKDGMFDIHTYPTDSMLLGHCPYGKPGANLHIRECWQYVDDDGQPIELFDNSTYAQTALNWRGSELGSVLYKADLDHCGQCPANVSTGLFHVTPKDYWQSPRFMPRWAARTELEVREVRVQRLLDITNADAEAEGVCLWAETMTAERFEKLHRAAGLWPLPSPRQSYLVWWDELNRRRAPSSSNPFVWALVARRNS